MTTVHEVAQRITTITFDCYGTLIDWRRGLTATFSELLGVDLEPRKEALFEAYVSAEAEVEAQGYRSYREILAEVAQRVADHFDAPVTNDRAALLAERLPEWKPFADTNEGLKRLKRRFRLGVLSNIDRDLFAGTARQFDVDFDFLVTAQDVRSYKPADGHFDRLLSEYAKAGEALHVAQSLFHDGVPATAQGIAYVWINRYNDQNATDVRPLGTYPDLASLASDLGV